jgi:hypothetical protein
VAFAVGAFAQVVGPAYQPLRSYRAAAQLCANTHKTVKRVVDKLEADQAGESPPPRVERERNYDSVAEMVAERVEKSQGRMSAKRMLPIARAAGYDGSARNFRRLVSEAKLLWRNDCFCSARCGRSPGGTSSRSPPTNAPRRRWR